jgi:hypothetical protein
VSSLSINLVLAASNINLQLDVIDGSNPDYFVNAIAPSHVIHASGRIPPIEYIPPNPVYAYCNGSEGAPPPFEYRGSMNRHWISAD